MANLRKKVPFGHLSQTLRWDIREFFGLYDALIALRPDWASAKETNVEPQTKLLKMRHPSSVADFHIRSMLAEDDLNVSDRTSPGCHLGST